MTQSGSDMATVDRFERAVVFRVARGYFFFSAIVGVLVLAGGIVAFGAGVLRVPPPQPIDPPPIPPPPAISISDVQAWMREVNAAKTVASAPSAIYEAPVNNRGRRSVEADATAEEIARLSSELKALFPEPDYVWDDVFEELCINKTPFGCLERGRRLQREGVAKMIKKTLAELSGSSEVLSALHLILPILRIAPVDQRSSLVGPILATERSIHGEHRRKVLEREQAIAQERARYEDVVREQEASKRQFREYGAYGAVGGLALLILVSIFLAHFAIERHLRALRNLTAALEQRGSVPAAETGLSLVAPAE